MLSHLAKCDGFGKKQEVMGIFNKLYNKREMKRDFDLIREILLYIEGLPPGFNRDQGSNFSDPETRHNLELLIDAGFINGKITHTGMGDAVTISKITYKGYDLLDSIREKSFFDKVKKYAKDKGAPLTFETIKIAAAAIAKQLLE